MASRERIQQVSVEVIREDDGSFAIACSALGVYAVGRTLREAKRSFAEALDLHLNVLRERALTAIAHTATV